MLNQPSSYRYFIYAIGEILLVVVGILIALQVNNWNEARKEKELANEILSQMEERISQDTIVLNRQIERFEKMKAESEWIIQQFDSDAPYISKMDSVLASISVFSFTEADYTAFNYLENVGIGIIKDQEMRDKITEYYRLSEHIYEVDKYFELNKYFRQEIYPKYFKRYRYGLYVVPNDFKALKQSNEFRIVLDMCYNDAIFYRGMTKGQKERAKELLKMIDKQLKE